MKYFIIASGYNCSSMVQDCYDSLIALEGDYSWSAVLINDGSTDNDATKTAIDNLGNDERITKYNYNDNRGAAYRRYEAIKNANLNDEDVIVLLGLDDRLMSKALIEMDRKYLLGCWMTYGNWKTPDGAMLEKGFLFFDEETHRSRDYRTVYYRSTAPNTFKKFLFDEFNEDDFKFNGEWVMATTESNLMFSLLEMCGKDRIGVIEEPIYIYNRGRIDSAKQRFGGNYQNKIFAEVKRKPKRQLIIR